MKYFIIALIVTNSLNAMRFGKPEAEATAAAIKSVVGTKPAAHQPVAKTPSPAESTTSERKAIKAKL